MNCNVPLAHFDRGKPFYPLIMQYVIQLVGFKELAIRSVAVKPDVQGVVSRIAGLAPESFADAADMATNLEKLLGPLSLQSSVRAEPLQVPVAEIATEVWSNLRYLGDYLLVSAGSVLILAHELCKDKPAHDCGPLWECLRHCRNAAGHGGRFNFKNGEPRRPAMWGPIEIVPELQGSPLFKGADGIGLMGPADPVLLLWAIEQAYPAL